MGRRLFLACERRSYYQQQINISISLLEYIHRPLLSTYQPVDREIAVPYSLPLVPSHSFVEIGLEIDPFYGYFNKVLWFCELSTLSLNVVFTTIPVQLIVVEHLVDLVLVVAVVEIDCIVAAAGVVVVEMAEIVVVDHLGILVAENHHVDHILVGQTTRTHRDDSF